jgi:hypothetical protein
MIPAPARETTMPSAWRRETRSRKITQETRTITTGWVEVISDPFVAVVVCSAR